MSFSLAADDVTEYCCLAKKIECEQCCRPMAIWEQYPGPKCPCPVPSGRLGKLLENAYVKVRPYGYVKWEAYWDSRQPLGIREETILFYPAPCMPDIFGQDINHHGKWNMDAIETRIGLTLTGPHWDCFKMEGLIEGDFRGTIDPVVGEFRLRHAFGRISWGTGSFLFGKWWHPLFILECFPHTVGFSIGAPEETQALSPQLLFTQRWNWFEFIAAAASQQDYRSFGPDGFSNVYIRNAVVPELCAEVRAYFNENDLIGFAADYFRLCPRLVSNDDVKVDEHIDSFIVEGFAAFVHAPWSLRLKAIWAQNANYQLMISGFGIRCVNPVTDFQTYSNTAAVAAWLDFTFNFGCDYHELGLYVGGTKNLGSRHALYLDPDTHLPIIYGLYGQSQNLDSELNVTPRYVFEKDPVRLGLEIDFRRASWGTPNQFGRVVNAIPVNLVRIMFALYFMF